MKKGEIFRLYLALLGLKEYSGLRFAYGVSKNINLLKSEAEAIISSQKKSEEYAKYEEERVALAQSHARKDANGNPIVSGDRYVIENSDVFGKKFSKLKLKHQKAIAEWEKKMKELETLLEEKASVELHRIKLKDVPDEISVGQLSEIYILIEE